MMHAEKQVAILRQELVDMQQLMGKDTGISAIPRSVGSGDRDAMLRLQHLQSQYEHLQSKSATQERKVEVSRALLCLVGGSHGRCLSRSMCNESEILGECSKISGVRRRSPM